MNSLTFFINGKRVSLGESQLDPRMTLLTYLRSIGLTGTKLGCGEGGCGACTVMISKHESGSVQHLSANACLTPLCSLDGYAVTTIEGIGGMQSGLHPIQARIASMHGSQCGFCTPGIIMAIYTKLRSSPDSTPHEIEESMDGNLCRCTGYRPILDAARSLSNAKGSSGGGCCGGGSNGGGGCPCFPGDTTANGQAEQKSSCCSGQSINNKFSLNAEMVARGLTEPIFPPSLVNYQHRPLSFRGDSGVTWHQPVDLQSLLHLKHDYPSAKLVVGNTEVGIETKFKQCEYPILINPTHIPELQVLHFDQAAGGLVVGAAVTVNALRDYISTLAKDSSKEKQHLVRGYEAIRAMVAWFASNHIRNVACIGGNIITASPISDLNPLLLATNAKLTLVSLANGQRVVAIDQFFLAYRKVDLRPDEIIQSIFIPHVTSPLEFVLPFKQARRREDDISIVTSGMRFKLREGDQGHVIEEVALAFGGMAVTSILAKKTMSALTGQPFSFATIEAAFPVMREELALSSTVPGGQAEFRMALTLSFLMKAFMTIQAELGDSGSDGDDSGRSNFLTADKPVTRGQQLFTPRVNGEGLQRARPVPHAPATTTSDTTAANTATCNSVVGQSMMHKSAESQVTGEAKYTNDKPLPANALYAVLVTAQRAHARLVSMDTSAAETCPGFVCFLSAKEVVGSNQIGPVIKDEEIFVSDEIKHYGAVLGAVLAETHEQAVYAARKVTVVYEDLPAIISIEDAIAANSFLTQPHSIRDGDVEEMKGTAAYHVSGTIRMGGQDHFYLETQNSVAIPIDNGALEVTSSTQACMETQAFCASVCGIPASKVNVICKRMGGGFGGKESRSVTFACIAALGAHRLQRPVSINLERDVDMAITGQRHAFLVHYSAGCDRHGQLSYLTAQLYSNGGYSLDLSTAVLTRALLHSDSVYRWPAIHVAGRVCRTNQPSHTAFRGFGGPQGLMVGETAITHLADVMKVKPESLKAKNLYQENDLTHFGQRLEGYYVPRLYQEITQAANVEARRQEIALFNASHRYVKRGLCVMATKFGINFGIRFLNQGGALVHVYTDGSVLIAHGGTEMGQGLHTKMIQVAATVFSIPDTMVFISETATSTIANSSPSAASLSTDLYGMAVLDACEQILERLQPVRASLAPDADWKTVVHSAYFQRVNLSAHGFYIVDNNRCGYDWSLPDTVPCRGHPFNYFTQGVCVTEVQIDCLSGDSRVLRADVLMDVGRSINPAIDIGQVEGAFMQGLGWSTIEELVWGDKEHPWVREGSLFTRGPGTYKIPAFNDVPVDFRVHLADTDNRFAVHSSKAVGEPPFFLGASALFAIKDAIKAARADTGCDDDYYPLDLPATSERIRLGCADRITALCALGGSGDTSSAGDGSRLRPLGSL